MQIVWNDKEPIYVQLRDRLANLILDGELREGEPVPSVRTISSEQRINPITVSKAFQLMVDEGLIEKQRGRGMYVVTGARSSLKELERERFLQVEWPDIRQKIQRLGLALNELPGGEAADAGSNDESIN